MFLTDDQRGDLLGHLGAPLIQTPHLDRMFEQGISLTGLFPSALDCLPSRVSIFSSLYPDTHGVRDNRSLVPESIRFLPQFFREAGFVTGGYGKLHEKQRSARGFDEMQSIVGSPAFEPVNIRWDSRRLESGESLLPVEQHHNHTITNHGLRFLDRHAREPFFLLISLLDPHEPYVTPRPFYENVDPARVPVLPFAANEPFWAGKHPTVVDHYRTNWNDVGLRELQRVVATYYAKLEFIDYEFGRVFAALEDLQVLDETLVFFLADQGDMSGHGGVMTKAGPLFYDPVTRLPAVLRYPGLGTGGRRIDSFLEGVDLAPTILELFQLPIPGEFEGQPSLSVLQGGAPLRDDVIVKKPLNGARMVRTREHKLIVHPDGWTEIYDLLADPDEMLNFIETADEELLADLRRRLARLD